MTIKVAYRVPKILYDGTVNLLHISIIVKEILLLGIFPKASRVLAVRIGMKLIYKSVFFLFHLGGKPLKLINIHFEP